MDPQLRLPSRYAELVGERASVYEASGSESDITVVIRFGVNKNQMADSGLRSLERFMKPESLKCLVGPVDATTQCMTSRTEVQHA